MVKYDVLEHEMVPEHKVLSDEEVEELTERYDIKKTDLPRIQKNDNAVKETDAEPGDVLKVVRDSWTTDSATAYRIVIDS